MKIPPKISLKRACHGFLKPRHILNFIICLTIRVSRSDGRCGGCLGRVGCCGCAPVRRSFTGCFGGACARVVRGCPGRGVRCAVRAVDGSRDGGDGEPSGKGEWPSA